jgi:cytochrome c oxidase subunit 2
MFFYVGFKGFMNYDNPVAGARQIEVIGQQWKFTFNYPNGATDGDLYVELNKPVVLNMHSVDVLHALYLPMFRTQRNLIPYRQTEVWFIPTELSPAPTKTDPGGWPIFCTQHCGNGHSRMFARVHVLATDDFNKKMTELANPFKRKEGERNFWVPYIQLGEKLYSQMGCSTCHSIDGKDGIGPTWKGLFKRDHEFASTDVPGYTLKSSDPDEKWLAYIHESIVSPDLKLVKLNGKSYSGMPSSYGSLLDGSPENIEKRRALIVYILSLGNPPPKLKFDPKSDVYDADKNPNFHPESLAAEQAATNPASPGQ